MILRSLLLRHGRLALPKPLSPFRPQQWRRFYASQIEHDSANLSERQQHSSGGDAQAPPASYSNPPIDICDPNHPVAQDWAFFQHQSAVTGHIGSSIAPHYKPHELLAYPPGPKDVTLELLLASQSHLGHHTSLWHPANSKYIFGIRRQANADPIHIISLDVTAAHLRRACKIMHGVTSRGGLVLFVGTREGQARAVVKAANLAGGCHLFDKWIPGTITNGQHILGGCRKKVVNEFDEEVEGFDEQLVRGAALKPDLVVCLNPLENYVLLHECGLNNIPTIGIIDTDTNPTWVTYPIPANDDSLRCVQVIAGVLGRAGELGQQERLAKAKRGVVDYSKPHDLTAPRSGRQRSGQNVRTQVGQTEADEAEEVHGFTLADSLRLDDAAGEDNEEVSTRQLETGMPAVRSFVSDSANDILALGGVPEEAGDASGSVDTLPETLEQNLEEHEDLPEESIQRATTLGHGNEEYRDQADHVDEPSADASKTRTLEMLERGQEQGRGFDELDEEQAREAGGTEIVGGQPANEREDR